MASHIRRRKFLATLGGAAAWPLAARAQQPSMPVVGFLRSTSSADSRNLVAVFRQGLREAGFVKGQDYAIEYRWADNQLDRLPALVADLLRRPVAVIVGNTPSALAAKAATKTVPIVFATGATRSGKASSPASTGRAATSPVSLTWDRQYPESGWSYSKKLRRESPSAPYCSIQRQRHMPNISWPRSRPLLHPSQSRQS